LLKRHKVKATFFVIGNKALNLKPLTERIIHEGHALGNHTIDHDTKRYFSGATGIKEWIMESEEVFTKNFGVPTVGFRSPVGIKTPPLNEALRILKLPLILWDVRFYDTTYGLTLPAVDKKLEHVRVGSIILLHDTHKGVRQEEFLKSLEFLIVEIKKRGFNFQLLDKSLIKSIYKF
jgi:peptidoglycan/xylan/chitin deacetylase (PgdA/CDA1 family)